MDRRRAVLLLLTTVALWSTSGLFVKILDWHPLAISGVRSAIAATVVWALARNLRWHWSPLLILGALSYVAAQSLFVVSTTLTTAANAIFLQYTAPVWVAFFGIWFLRERAQAVDWWTMAAIFVGMALFFGDQLTPEGMLGNLLAIINGVTFAWMILIMRKQRDNSPETMAILGNALCALLGIPFLWQSWQGGTLPDATGWIILVYLGIFQLGIPYLLFASAIRHLRAIESVLIQTLEPILNPLWVFLLIGETPGPWSLAGGLVVLTAVTARSVLLSRQGAPRPLPEPAA